MFKAVALVCFIAQIFAVRHYIKIMYPTLGWNTLLSKLLCSSLFTAVAVLGILDGGMTVFSKFMLVGFICSLLGDGFLHMYPKLGSVYVNYALGGLSFLAGHIFFITAILMPNILVFRSSTAMMIIQIALAVLLDAAVMIFLCSKMKLGKFLLPVAVYGLVLMFMVVNAFSLGISAASESVGGAAAMTLTLGLGSACFAASDIVLATDFFSGGKDIKKKKANIILYYSGQMLMAASLFATVLVK